MSDGGFIDFDPDAAQQPDRANYPGAAIDVRYDRRLCIHAAECGRGASEVFDAKKDRWIDPDQATVEQVIAVVERCPTGALTYVRKDGGERGAPPGANTVTISPDGPVYLSGRVDMGDGEHQARVALCRCGQSKNKPYCDRAHAKAGFHDSGPVAGDPETVELEDGPLQVTAFPNGPVRVKGPMTLYSGSGRIAYRGDQIFLCRCGQSSNRPFCDGNHKTAGFTSD